ncbi:hypothetical protein AB205_0049270 [Aquarana catesbeiana]|uniref:Protein shisa-5 n=1 Tax=Aquarana catesbeiana TaxID=8400 RepID=A0A2G9RWE2_AQUCT|nr:hypothetical protein AB205_0049270 [Aquarana catesbeiana]
MFVILNMSHFITFSLYFFNSLYFVIGAGIIISLLTVISIISCICKSLCLCCRLCERQPRATALTTSVAVTNINPQPLVTMPVAAGYQPVPHSMYAQRPDKASVPPPYPGEAPAYSNYPTR